MYISDMNDPLNDDEQDYIRDNMLWEDECWVFDNYVDEQGDINIMGYDFSPAFILYELDPSFYDDELNKFYTENDDWINDGFGNVYEAEKFYQLLNDYRDRG